MAAASRVVILGCGFAGLSVARRLERSEAARSGALAITVVNRRNYMLFTPMLPEVAVGGVEPRHVAEPVRAALPRARFELGELTGVDVPGRTVTVRHPILETSTAIAYDHLVIALGAESSTHGIPGAAERALPLTSLDDAIRLRDALIDALEVASGLPESDVERSRLLTVVVVGGGFTGVEAAGEIKAFMHGARRRFYPGVRPSELRVVLVNARDELLEQLPARFGDRAKQMFAERGIELALGDDVAEVDRDGIRLASGRRYGSHTIVWSAGVRPAPLIAQIDVPRSKHGAVVVDPDLSVPGREGVWALGDCAQIPKPGGGFYPQTAQHAVREGPLLAENLLATLRGARTRPFRYRSLGMMASLGAREGLADVMGASIAGFPAWLLWRAYYLSELPGLDRKARVGLDWTIALAFPHTGIASVR